MRVIFLRDGGCRISNLLMTKALRISLASLALTSAIVSPAFASSANARPMTETDLATMKRIGAPAVSPDGKLVAYQLRETDLAANKGKLDIYVVPTQGGEPVKIASKADKNEHSPAFSRDGKFLYFISNESGSDQIWRVSVAGNDAIQVSQFKTDVAGFKLSNAGGKIAVWGDVAKECATFGCDDGGNKAERGPGTGREYDAEDGFVRHWSNWETPGNYSRLYAFDLSADGKVSGAGIAMDRGVTGDTPTKPFGGGEEISWTPSDKGLIFTARKADRSEPKSTNTDLYGADVAGAEDAVNLTAANLATDTLPLPSPDGKWLAYAAMERATYEADRLVLQLLDMKAERRPKTIALTKDWDRSVGSIAWALDSKSLFVTAQDTLDHPAYRVTLDGKVTRLTKSGNIGDVVPLPGGGMIYSKNSLQAPSDLYRMDAKGKETQLTNVNAAALAEIGKVVVQRFEFAGANGDKVWGQITKPESAKASGEKLPLLFVVHGGPQGSFGDSWSFRWNPKVMASQGYAVVTIDFHGSTGYGQKFTDSINQDWGGKPLEDLRLGLAAAATLDGQIDTGNACALGASYGGYMMNWIAGNWPDGFKCLVNHAGIFDLRSFAFSTEELWFDQWDHGGTWWD
ncbi:MAG: hypothetical protein RL481_483, partial [Pseudomonadota bacterium]